ncbi:endonuclease domain-containing protein [Microbacterium lacusdiani]
MPDHAFLVGVAAAVLHGIPVPPSAVAPVNGAPPDLSVGVWDPRTPPRRAGVRGVRVTRARAAVVEVEGIRVTSLADTWAMLAEALDEHDLVAAADHLLRVPRPPGGFRPPDRGPYCTREQLEAAIGTRRGAAKLRCALARARTGASSPQESKLRLVLVDDGLREPVLDHDVFDGHGRFVACVDLAYPELRLAIEYDGEVHRTQEQFERDVERLARLEALGWTVLRFTARHLREQRPLILSRVRAAVARAGR